MGTQKPGQECWTLADISSLPAYTVSAAHEIFVEPDLKELRKPWANLICEENTLYSGHLLLKKALYAMLFDDDRYGQDDSMVCDWNPEATIKEMEANGRIGVCCEPNMVFIAWNQFPL
ncbi:hypothetical protein ACQKWADRAFT_316521 [Trichoderma austrokoningii]